MGGNALSNNIGWIGKNWRVCVEKGKGRRTAEERGGGTTPAFRHMGIWAGSIIRQRNPDLCLADRIGHHSLDPSAKLVVRDLVANPLPHIDPDYSTGIYTPVEARTQRQAEVVGVVVCDVPFSCSCLWQQSHTTRTWSASTAARLLSS